MAAVATVHDRFPQDSVSDAKPVGQKPRFSLVTWILIGGVLLSLLMLPVNMWRESLIADGFAQGQQSAQAELRQLRADLKQTNVELTQLRTDLKAEVARKSALAVANTRLIGERDRAVADLQIAMEKLKAKEANKPAAAPPAKRQQRRG